MLKSIADRILAVIFIIVASPLMLLISISILIESLFDRNAGGPIICKETRISQGRPFKMMKFRTLNRTAFQKTSDEISISYLQLDRQQNVTRAGRVLLKYYLDELPQLFHVVSGRMSLVGPRPLTPTVYEECLKEGFVALKHLKGGLAGPHQASKGTPHHSLERSEEYLDKHKAHGPLGIFLHDVYYMIKTVLKVLKGEGL